MKIVNWEVSPIKLDLPDCCVHLWKSELDVSSSKLEHLAKSLSADEIARANRFKFLEHKNRFIAARGFLRQILSKYLQKSAKDIVLKYSDRGKPLLVNTDIRFNISHSQNIALYCVTRHNPIGVDLEYLKKKIEHDKIASRFFNESEYRAITELIPDKRNQAFFQLWTIKEAYLKATGEGLGGGLETVTVKLDNDLQTEVKAIGSDRNEINNWCFWSFIPQENFVATVAVKTKSLKQSRLNIQYYSL